MARFAVVFALATIVATACAAPAAEQKAASPSGPGAMATSALPAEVVAFHDVLKPLWHATPGAERTAGVCAAAARMHEMATAMTATTPANVKPEFPARAESLGAATAHLESVCATDDKADFEAAFHAVHEAFHGVAEKCEG